MANEHPNTYIVQDRANQDEMTRLHIQDQITTQGMGGVLPEQPDPSHFRNILDIGCGTGNWLIEVALAYPTIKQLVGIDASQEMLTYARAQARKHQVEDRVTFRAMDALLLLDFPEASFDLVNERYASSFVRSWEWQKFLGECNRVCRRGGLIRLTEGDADMHSNSPALNQITALFIEASSLAGRAFLSNQWGKTEELVPLLERHGCTQVQGKKHKLVFRATTEEGQLFIQDMTRLYKNIVPYLQKHIRLPNNYQEQYQQALIEMQHPDFAATWNLLTVWGITPPKKR